MYAHSLQDRPVADWEPLDAHLTAVGGLAEALAAKFGAGALGLAAGLLHDLGKAKPGFQAYLRGERGSEPHAAEGARAAEALYGAPLGRLLAYGIAGHHAGLADSHGDHGGLSSLADRLAGAAELAADPPPPTPEAIVAALQAAPAFLAALQRPFGRFMAARMLFSCLVDADFLATEGFYDASNGLTTARGWDGDLATLETSLDAHLAGLPDAAAPGVARARKAVLAACRARAAAPPGLFSLTVPTGGGKTLSSLAFALAHARAHGLDRVIYVAPFTAIIEQTAAVFRSALADSAAILEHHSAFDWKGLRDPREEEAPDGADAMRRAAENWDRPIVVTTAVQFFESLFANRPSRCRKLHNMVRSVVILDEAQSLPLKLLRPCLAAIDELARTYGSTVVLCTATQPAVRQEDGFLAAAEALQNVREIAPDPPALYASLRRVKVERIGEQDDGALVARLAAEAQALVIVNNRRHARELFQALRQARPQADIRHLSTAMTAAHRRTVLEDVRRRLRDGLPTLVVSTSLVEAGVDIDFPAVYRAVAGLDSVAQAAGRCNRGGALGPGGGRVYVFEPAEGEGRAPPPELKAFAAAAEATLLRQGEADPLSLAVIQDYFGEVYFTRGGEGGALLDDLGLPQGRGVLRVVQEGWQAANFPYASIAEAFRLIESDMRPLIVPAAYAGDPSWGASEELMGALRHGEPPLGARGLARRLQTFLVQVPPRARDALIHAGAAEILRPEVYGDQFVALTKSADYDAAVGLNWASPNERSPQDNIL